MKNVLIFLLVSFLLNIYCVRVFAVGELDTTFNLTGRASVSFGHPNTFLHDISTQQDGKIVAVGEFYNNGNYDIAVARFNTDGSLDMSFDGDGKVTTPVSQGSDSAKSVAIQPDGKIIVGGSAANSLAFDFALVRYNVDGSLDTSFGTGGKVITSVGAFYSSISSIAIQPDGKIVAVGDAFGDEKDFAVVRYLKDGQLDSSFDNDGILLTAITPGLTESASSVAIQYDGKIVVCGVSSDTVSAPSFLTTFSFVLVRYNRNGSLDTSLDEDGKLIAFFGSETEFANSVLIQTDGKLLLSGTFGTGGMLVRYNSNGSLDTEFDIDGVKIFSNEPIGSPVIQPDGKILFYRRLGAFPNWTYVTTRINTDGSTDNTFGTNGNVENVSGDMSLQTDGKIVLGASGGGLFGISRLTGDSPIPATAHISGQIVDSQGRAISKARVIATNLQTSETKIIQANPFGYFRFINLPTNNIYQIAASSKGHRFSESTQTIRLLGDVNGLAIASE